MSQLPGTTRLRLTPSHRIHWEDEQQGFILLYPGGLVRLERKDAELLVRCDGQRTWSQVVSELRDLNPNIATGDDALALLSAALSAGWVQVA